MDATDELRAELTKRGVEWKAPSSFDGTARYDTTAGGYWFHEFDGKITIHGLTPAQAIAATLGSEDTYTREDVEGAFVSGYSLGLDMFDSSKPEKGWNQNERNLDEEMEDLGWVRKDAATLGAGTCHAIISDNLTESEGMGDAWADCSECGHLLFVLTDPNSEPPNYCPNCGRRVVKVDE